MATSSDGGPLTYSWSTTGGTVSGSRPEATLDATDVLPGLIVVTGTVSDDRTPPLTASCTVTVQIAAPTVASPESPYQNYSIIGVVVDAKDRPVNGAEITLSDPDTQFKGNPTMTNSKGEFSFESLIASTYRMQARKGSLSSPMTEVRLGSEKVVHTKLVVK